MTIHIHIREQQLLVALLLHFVLLASLSWKLTRYSDDLSLAAVLLLCVLGQVIFTFGFATERLEGICFAVLFNFWVNWLFLGYVAELDRPERIALSISSPIIGLIAVLAVHLAVGQIGKTANKTSLLTPDPPPIPVVMTATTSIHSRSLAPGQA